MMRRIEPNRHLRWNSLLSRFLGINLSLLMIQVFVWFSILNFPFYTIIFMNRLEIFCSDLFRVSGPDPDPYWIRIQSGQWIRNPDPDPGGQK
jgi:hypothetical protein